MNTNPKAKRILCFGDSNTRGFVAGSGGKERHPADVRWTGILQMKLGTEYEVIEEGLDARLIAHDDPRPGFVGKNGLAYLVPCLDSHKPLDLVIVMLGTPDLKECMHLSPEDIVEDMAKMISYIKESKTGRNEGAPKILLIAPAIIDETTAFAAFMFKGGTEKNRKLCPLYAALAHEKRIDFLDASTVAEVDLAEGVHITRESHATLADVLVKKILNS